MVLGHEAPETRVGRVVAVVAHHPVVVHLEGVAVAALAVDVDAVVAHLEVVVLIDIYYAAVERKDILREGYRGTLLGNPQRAEVVGCPRVTRIMRESLVLGRVTRDADDVVHLEQLLHVAVRQGQEVVVPAARAFGYAQLLECVLCQRRRGAHRVAILFLGDGLLRLAVYEEFRIDYAYRVPGHCDTALDVVLALVYGACYYGVVLLQLAATLLRPVLLLIVAQHVVIGHGLILQKNSIPCREVKYHHVVAFDLSQTLQSVVRPFDALAE